MEMIVRRWLPLLIVLGVMLVVGLLLRSKAYKLGSISDLDSKVGQGKPVVLEFFSNL